MHSNLTLRLFFLALLLAAGCAPAAVTPKREYDKAMEKLNGAKDGYHRWCALNNAAKESLNAGHDADAKAYAEELERLAPEYAKDWNYGNAIQDFNLVFGSLALKAGDRETAKKHLLEAGRSPGSPQMNSFGPDMSLAKALLAAGEKETVLKYFQLCKKFWKLHRGKLDHWKTDVEAGRNPDFGANLRY